MENRRLVLIVILFLAFAKNAFAYGVETHGLLTAEIVDFYNKNFPSNKISGDLKMYLVDGARLEDNVPRYFNHFYDPVNNRGLAEKIYQGMASKLWAQDEKEQLALIYRILPQTEIPILLTALQIQKIKPDFNQSNFTWQKAIDLYAKGEKEKALFALGHTLHLIEDASVPDHTRNDSHPPFDDGGSPYENWTHKFDLKNPDPNLKSRLANKRPILLSNLNEYFDGIAKYSNNNFYSKDSIKNYELPEVDYSSVFGRYSYAFKKDREFGDYKLAVYFGDEEVEWNGQKKLSLVDKQGDLVMIDYWHRLSVKAVQYGAGVVDLFFKEAEAARQKYLTEKSQRPFLATLIDGVGAIFGGNDAKDPSDLVNEFKLVDEIPIRNEIASSDEGRTRNDKAETVPAPAPAVFDSTSVILSDSEGSQDSSSATEIGTQNDDAEPKICPFATTQPPSRQGIILNEVAWMGTAESSSNEWIELQNRSSAEIDLTGFSLVDMDEKIKVNLAGKIPAGGFWLLERTDDDSVPGIAADQIYTGSLENAGEGLRLFDKGCNLIDEVFASPDWPAGDNNYKKTMERAADFSWRTYSGENAGGTPKAQNSEGIIPVNNSGGSAPQPAQSQPQQPAPEPQPEQAPQPSQQVLKVLISEILFDAEGSDGGKEFIELYNPNDQAADLSSWSVQHLSFSGTLSKKNFEAGDAISPKGFFLIWLGSDPRADLTWSSGSLNNSSAAVYLVNNTEQVSTSSPTAVDAVSYDVANLPGFVAGRSLERKAMVNNACATMQGSAEYAGNGCDTDSGGDFELREVPNPQNTQSLPEPRSAPSAVTDLQISYASTSLSTASSTTSELIFNWGAVTGADKYHIIDVATTTATSASLAISETGREYSFIAYAVDKDGFYSSSTTAVIFIEPPVGGDGGEPPQPEAPAAAAGISNIIFSHDDGGNYLSFTLNDALNDSNLVRYILVWFNEDPKEMWDPANRSSGLVHNWAGYCPSTGNVIGNGGTEGGTGFDNYVVSGYEPDNKPPVYDASQASYSYKIYFAESCPSAGFHQGRDLKGELTAEDFVTLGWWFYDPVMGFINETKSTNYPTKIYFQP